MKKIIFLHSGFRCGSTYFFNKFDALNRYVCFQEPLHENILNSQFNKEALTKLGNPAANYLRHNQQKNYYQELIELSNANINCFPSAIVYKNFFDKRLDEDIQSYLTSLIREGGEEIFIKECRLVNRISATKAQLGGIHFYLYRNPIDQWWSGKISRYFEAVWKITSLSPNAPSALADLAKELDLVSVDSANINDAIFTNWWKVLTPKQSYTLFYMLWSLALIEGLHASDCLISIDRLSRSDEYKAKIQNHLVNDFDVGYINFEDVKIPIMQFSEEEIAWYKEIEVDVYDRLRGSGISDDFLETLVDIRSELYDVCKSERNRHTLLSDSSIRSICTRLEDEIASYRHHLNIKSDQNNIVSILKGYQPLIEQIIGDRTSFNREYKSLYATSLTELVDLKSKCNILLNENLRLKESEKELDNITQQYKEMVKLAAKVNEENKINQAFLSASLENCAKLFLNLEEAENKNKYLKEEMDSFREKYSNILLSNSWRITKPLRFLFRLLGISK